MPLTDAQLETRRTRIAASDVSVILGLNPWKSPADLWLEKTQDVEPIEETEAIAIGNMVESPLVDWCAGTLGVRPDRELGTVTHPEHDWLCATPDAGIVGQRRGIECKSAGIVRGFVESDKWGEADSAEVPEQYWVQCQVQMACLAWDAVWLAAIVAGRGRVRYFIPRNQAAIEGVIDVCEEWHRRCVVLGERPGDDSLPATETLKRIRRTPGKVARVDASLVVAYREACERVKSAEDAKDAAKAALLYAGPDCDGFDSDAGGYTYLTQTRRGIDLERLRADYPEAAEACAKISTFPVLRAAKARKGI